MLHVMLVAEPNMHIEIYLLPPCFNLQPGICPSTRKEVLSIGHSVGCGHLFQHGMLIMCIDTISGILHFKQK